MSVNYIEKLEALDGTAQLREFIAMCDDVESVQAEVLRDIIARNRKCAFGREHNFENISTIAEYRKAVPLHHWNDFEPYSKKMQGGETDILFEGSTAYFTISSGTTGKDKLIPESEIGSLAKKVIGDLRNTHLLNSYPELIKGKFLPLSNPSTVGTTECGIPYGAASGLTTRSVTPEIQKINACPSAAKEIPDQETADYAIMRFAIAEDVRTITGNNAGRIPPLLQLAEANAEQIISDIEYGTLCEDRYIPEEIREKLVPALIPAPERAQELRKGLQNGERFVPALYWPNLKVIRCWLSGSVGRYVDKLSPWVSEDVVLIDGGFGSSECKFNIPLSDGKAGGPLTLFAAFYEFIEVAAEEDARILAAHELEESKEYRIVVTTYSGLYRYDIKDIIRVEGFTGTTPNIVFVSKTTDVANIGGEKISATLLTLACNAAAAELNFDLTHFCVVTDIERQRYVFHIEPASGSAMTDAIRDGLARHIDKFLFNEAIMYRSFRQQKLLKKAEVVIMPIGWQQSLYEEKMKKGLSISQIKLPVIYDSI